jgi:hypothetical protein
LSIKLDNFDYDLVEQYYIKNLNENNFWLFGSHADTENVVSSKNADFDAKEFLEKTIFGIKYTSSDFSFMIQRNFWRSNIIYTQYDDTEILVDTPFYVTVEPESEGGNYHIFKCISNNNNAVSTSKPTFNNSIANGIYYLPDGYIWKYMTSVPFTWFRKFSGRGLIPVLRSQEVEDLAVEGIFNIKVLNRNENFGYERITGEVRSTDIQSGIVRVFLKNTYSETLKQIPVFETPNLYVNRTLYVEKSSLESSIGAIEVQIIQSGVISGQPFVTVNITEGFNISIDDKIEILPKVVIQGDGIGSSAIAIFDDLNQRIDSIRMLQFGENYTSAIARVLDPIGFDPFNINRTDIRCTIKPIISPRGGHGFNVISELKCRHIGLSKNISNTGFSNIPTSGVYNKVGLVKNPEFSILYEDNTFDNRIKIVFNVLPPLSVGNIIQQGNVTALIHEIVPAENAIYVVEYDGPYSDILVDSLPISFGNLNFDINSIEYSSYISKSGTPLIIINSAPIERTSEDSENIKIILDF